MRTAGDTGDIRLRLSPCNLRRRPWETSRGFPPLGGNPCRPSLGALGRPRSLWAASDPQADPERLPHELPSAPREPRRASGPGVEAMADDVWAWCDKAKAFGRTVTVKVKLADFRQVTRSRSFSTVIARQDLLRQASVELVRTLLPTARGVRLLGVTVSNFDSAPAEDDELPLFGSGGAIVPRPDTAPRVAATGSR